MQKICKCIAQAKRGLRCTVGLNLRNGNIEFSWRCNLAYRYGIHFLEEKNSKLISFGKFGMADTKVSLQGMPNSDTTKNMSADIRFAIQATIIWLESQKSFTK